MAVYLQVDLSSVMSTMALMEKILSKSNFNKLMYRTFKEVAQKSKTLIAREVVKEYAVTQGWVKSAVQKYHLSTGGGGVKCVIPLRGNQGSIGGTFHASWSRGGPMTAKILKGASSTLPSVMSHQGGNPPFMAMGVGFTRRTRKRLPIVHISGLAAPQMPMNRAAEAVEEALLDYVEERLDHNFEYLFL
ncbi:MAG: hypothetical protein IKI81_02360 [Selenomonadaceae bacterium]|nr:hypothetical protein [Selenomonadaceae bacterium]